MDKWINVNDELPKHEIDANGDLIQYIVCMDDRVTVAYFMKGTDLKVFYSFDSEGSYCLHDDVTHWQPLPEIPNEDNKE